MRMSLAAAAALSAILVTAGSALTAEHLVTPEAARQRLAGAVEAREADLTAVRGVLSRPEAASAARLLGADASGLKAAAATLSDAELRDLARRAQALQADPVAGLTADVNTLLVVFLIVAIVILVLRAVD
jgi:hypothetical protein